MEEQSKSTSTYNEEVYISLREWLPLYFTHFMIFFPIIVFFSFFSFYVTFFLLAINVLGFIFYFLSFKYLYKSAISIDSSKIVLSDCFSKDIIEFKLIKSAKFYQFDYMKTPIIFFLKPKRVYPKWFVWRFFTKGILLNLPENLQVFFSFKRLSGNYQTI